MEEAVKRWLSLPDEQRLLKNTHYKASYEAAYRFCDRPIPKPWEDLTHEERDKVRQECIRYQREMQEFGESLREED